MPLTTGQQAVLFTIALVFVGVGALGGSNQLTTYGLPPIAGLVIFVLGLIGTAIIKAYGLGQQVALKAHLPK